MIHLYSNSTQIHQIGEGGHWKVYRADLKYNGRETVIVKHPKHGEDCDKTIEIWDKLKNAGLPTSAFMEAGTLDGKLVVITEDLDFDDHCFISPNTKPITEMDKMLAMLDNKQLLFASMSEQHFYENKMSGVKGLEAMYEKMRKDLRTISAMGYSIYCDAYYFSASDSSYPIEYRIADWDCISNIEMTEEELLETNANEFNTAITEFFMHFVEGEFKSNDSYKPFTL